MKQTTKLYWVSIACECWTLSGFLERMDRKYAFADYWRAVRYGHPGST